MNASRSEGAAAPAGRCVYCGGSTPPLVLAISSAMSTRYHQACRDGHRRLTRPPTPISGLLVRELRELAQRAPDAHDAALVDEAAARLEERIAEGGRR